MFQKRIVANFIQVTYSKIFEKKNNRMGRKHFRQKETLKKKKKIRIQV